MMPVEQPVELAALLRSLEECERDLRRAGEPALTDDATTG
jgi:hypothetical protein